MRKLCGTSHSPNKRRSGFSSKNSFSLWSPFSTQSQNPALSLSVESCLFRLPACNSPPSIHTEPFVPSILGKIKHCPSSMPCTSSLPYLSMCMYFLNGINLPPTIQIAFFLLYLLLCLLP